jgi:DNA replicative helicase MCM subunit Mcm2 (Cdc46/Mcm family)
MESSNISDEAEIHFTLLTRLLWFVLKDEANRERDEQVARAILRGAPKKGEYDDAFLRDLIVYARAKIFPVLRSEEEERIIKLYTSLRWNLGSKAAKSRFVEQARALTLLSAKLHLREETSKEDLDVACGILRASLESIKYDNSKLSGVTF